MFRSSSHVQRHEQLLLPRSTHIPLYSHLEQPSTRGVVDRFRHDRDNLKRFAAMPTVALLRMLWIPSIQTYLQDDLHRRLQEEHVSEQMNYGPETLQIFHRQLGPVQRYLAGMEPWLGLLHELSMDHNPRSLRTEHAVTTTLQSLLQDCCFRMEQYYHALDEDHRALYQAVFHQAYHPDRRDLQFFDRVLHGSPEDCAKHAVLRHFYDLLHSCHDVWIHLVLVLERVFNILQASLAAREPVADLYSRIHGWQRVGLVSASPCMPLAPETWRDDLQRWSTGEAEVLLASVLPFVRRSDEAWHAQCLHMLECRRMWVSTEDLQAAHARWGRIHGMRLRWMIITAQLMEHCENVEQS